MTTTKWAGALLALAAVADVAASPLPNVALGAAVELLGTFFVGGYPGGQTVDAATVTDGQLLPASTYWQHGSVWWHEPVGSGQQIVIHLNGAYAISNLLVQADDNDGYELYMRHGARSAWQLLWRVPDVNVYQGKDLFGMQTRPDPDDPAQKHRLPVPVVATDLMIRGGAVGDTLFAVSEVQAFGRPLTAPPTMALLAAALTLCGLVARSAGRASGGRASGIRTGG